MKINKRKTKELVIDFSKTRTNFPATRIDGTDTMNTIHPNTPYIEALANVELISLKERRAQLNEHFFT